jgi:fused signal recognition particle receptor
MINPLSPSDPSSSPERIVYLDDEQSAAASGLAEEVQKKGWFSRLREGLKRSSGSLVQNVSDLVAKKRLDEETLQDLEDCLIQADLGTETAWDVVERLRRERFGKDVSEEDIRTALAGEISKRLSDKARPLALYPDRKPHIILMVGVNGTGKTTTLGKLCAKIQRAGLKPMLAAGDTFRAAAVEQLVVWGERTGTEVVTAGHGADPSGLVFDAIQKAKKEGVDVLLIDTAGRLHNRAELMAELSKMIRVIQKCDPSAPHDVLLTLDATTGQNAARQVEIFSREAQVSGLIMTKLDGTAKGGILVSLAARFPLPVHFIGVGEGLDDLQVFQPEAFSALLTGQSMAPNAAE